MSEEFISLPQCLSGKSDFGFMPIMKTGIYTSKLPDFHNFAGLEPELSKQTLK